MKYCIRVKRVITETVEDYYELTVEAPDFLDSLEEDDLKEALTEIDLVDSIKDLEPVHTVITEASVSHSLSGVYAFDSDDDTPPVYSLVLVTKKNGESLDLAPL